MSTEKHITDKVIMVTGGTGSFGKQFISHVLKTQSPKKLIVFSRDELKQFEMQKDYGNNDVLRFFLGDVRDQDRLLRAFHGVDVVIHAAAVSDFQLKRPFKAKLRSGKRLTLELVATAKLIEGIKRKNPNIFLVGFKLEPTLNKNSARRFVRDLFKKAKCDLVVVNSLNRGQYSAFIVNKDNNIIASAKNRNSIVQALIKTI